MRSDFNQGTLSFLAQKDTILLAKIGYPNGETYWNGVGGFVEIHETPEEAVVREVHEELGVRITENSLKKLDTVSISSMALHIYLINDWQDDIRILDPTIKEVAWFKFTHIPYNQMWPGTKDWLRPLLLGTSKITT